jgi:inosose dehydratase
MKIGCFALVQPFSNLQRQFELIGEMGFEYADVTDNHSGASLGAEFQFAATASLQSHPIYLREMAATYNITLTSVCAHANLLDPASPSRYGTNEIIDAIKLAHFLNVDQVITTEGDPKTSFSKNFSREENILLITEKLWEPVQWAKELGIELLIEPHGEITDSLEATKVLLDRLGEPETVGLNLDTGNLWLGGGDPLAYVEEFGSRIKHVHWKDMGKEWLSERGRIFGCGMAQIPLGDGLIPIEAIVRELMKIGFSGPTTLEIAGKEAVMISAERLNSWSKASS